MKTFVMLLIKDITFNLSLTFAYIVTQMCVFLSKAIVGIKVYIVRAAVVKIICFALVKICIISLSRLTITNLC
jgi:hypothetical protein